LMHWSDTAVKIDKYLTAYLGCDNYFVWGKAHVTGVEGGVNIVKPTGYAFKKFIKNVAADRNGVLKKMGIKSEGKIASFFDETFRSSCKMTEKHYLNFWRATLDFARKNQDCTVLVKPKTLERYKGLSAELIPEFLGLKAEIEKLDNAYIVDDKRWSFIEVIGVSDLAVTQGMFSSATIAIICGIEGLYLDEAGYNHPFRERFTGRIVFDDAESLLRMAERIVKGEGSPIKDISEELLREFDAFSDDDGVGRLREALVRG